MTINVQNVSAEHRPLALRVLFARFPLEEQQARLAEALNSAERGQLKLDGLLLAEEADKPVGAALSMHQSDGVSLVWPPVVTCQTSNEKAVVDALMTQLCADIDAAGSRMAQALLSPQDDVETKLLERFGFAYATDMFFLARTLTPEDIAREPTQSEIDHEIFHAGNENRFASVIERTYRDSLDCPFLDGIRNGSDALVGHRISGRFDPAGWRLYRAGSEDVGVVLMNEHPDQNAIELVYFGIVPEFRGRGIGRILLADCLQAAAMTGRAVVFLSVDCGNVYANALYDELDFTELARRRIMIRRSEQLARK